GVIDANDRRTVAHGHFHDLHDLLGMDHAEASPKDGGILAEDVYQPPVDCAPAGYHAVAQVFLPVHVEVGFAVDDESIDLVKAALIEKQVEALACRHLAPLSLPLDAFRATALRGLFPQLT